MLFIKKRTVIRLISFMLAFAALSVILLLQSSLSAIGSKKSDRMSNVSTVSLLSSYTDRLCSTFETAKAFGSYEEFEKDIISCCAAVKTAVSYSEKELPDLCLWFTDLEEYAKTGMDDREKNDRYYKDALSIREALVYASDCYLEKRDEPFKKLNEFFDSQKDTGYYNGIIKSRENNYAMLKYYENEEAASLNTSLKNVLDYPLAVSKYKELFAFPELYSFQAKNSYAALTQKGGLLSIMAIDSQSVKSDGEKMLQPEEICLSFIKQYIPSHEDFCEVYSTEQNGLYYSYCCPLYTYSGESLPVYSEMIKVIINRSTGKLLGFDSTEYLKNHTATRVVNTPKKSFIPRPLNYSESRRVLIGSDIYNQYKAEYNGKVRYSFIRLSENEKLFYCCEEQLPFILQNKN